MKAINLKKPTKREKCAFNSVYLHPSHFMKNMNILFGNYLISYLVSQVGLPA